MKEYKVEANTFYSKVSLNKQHIIESSQPWIQEKMDEYASVGWTLTSTNITSFGAALYVYLFFEREALGKLVDPT